MRTLIADNGVEIPRGEDAVIEITLSPAADVSAWSGDFVLTLREDPDYPRETRAELQAAKSGDVDADSWGTVASSTTATVTNSTTGVIEIALPRATTLALSVGTKRYVAAAWRVESGATWQIWGPEWVSVVPSVRDDL